MRICLIVFSTLLLITGALAQSAGTNQQISPADVQALVNRIGQLERRVADLEAKQGTAPAPTSTQNAAVQTQAPSSTVPPGTDPEAGQNVEQKAPRTSTMDEMAGMR